MSVVARLVEDIDAPAGQVAGSIEMRLAYQSEGIAGIAFRCPCGCGEEGYLPIRASGAERTDMPEWEWDGNAQAPTVSPSVFNKGFPCRWHGWLRNGVWEVA